MELGSICPYTQECITFIMIGCDGIHHQGCEHKPVKESNPFADEKYFMSEAERYATENSTCSRTRVGAIIVNNGKIISYGTNHTHSSIVSCKEFECPKKDPEYAYALWDGLEICRGIHAEWDAILKANRHDLIGATMFVTHEPCFICTRIILQSGIRQIIYKKEFDTEPIKLREQLIKESGIIVKKINDSGRDTNVK
jgi:dCMP deaminase